MSSTSRSRSSTPSRDSTQSSDETIDSTTRRISNNSHPSSPFTPTVSSPIAMRKTSTGSSMHFASSSHHNTFRSRNTSAASSPSSPARSRTIIMAQATPPSSPSASSTTGAPSVPGSPFNFKLFKKCKSATFQIDGATYTIGMYHYDL